MATTTRPNQREHILDVALGLISEHGAAAMSMRQLAQSCGLGVAALYHYFPSKDALVAAVVAERRYGARLADRPALPADGPLETRVRALFAEMWHGAIEEESVWRLLLGEGIRGELAVLPVGAELLATVRDGLSAWIAAAIPELDAPTAAEIMMGQMFAGFIEHIFNPSTDVDGIGARGAEVVVGLLCAER